MRELFRSKMLIQELLEEVHRKPALFVSGAQKPLLLIIHGAGLRCACVNMQNIHVFLVIPTHQNNIKNIQYEVCTGRFIHSKADTRGSFEWVKLYPNFLVNMLPNRHV